MSRVDCISNRNIKIAASYVAHKLGGYGHLFEGMPYPSDRFPSAEDFFLNEDEWTTYQNFLAIFRRAKEMVDEPYFYFNCGSSAARLRSWGRLDYFVPIFTSPSDGFRRLPFFNRQFTDTKDIEVLVPPSYDKAFRKMRTLLEIRHHEDLDVHEDYLGDPYSRGMISSIPTIWGLQPALVRQLMNPYDPEILFNQEPELSPFGLDPKIENHWLTVSHPAYGHRKAVGKKVILIPELINGRPVYLGKYKDMDDGQSLSEDGEREAILITETVQVGQRTLLKAGELFKAPSFVLDVTYDRLSLRGRLYNTFVSRRNSDESAVGFIETVNELKETIVARNRAYLELEKANAELSEAKTRVHEYALTLEQKVEERTKALSRAQEELKIFNQDLEAKVKEHVEQLRRYNELRRYLSPKLSEIILSSGNSLGAAPQRKMMTVVFSDIRNFTSFTENLEPEELFPLMDKYLSEMTKIIHQYDGTLNKIIGDGLLVFYGDPIPMADHAQRAVMMAIDMQKKVVELKDEWLEYGHDFGVGIGINTGYMTVGNIGSEIHKDYTVIGNQVNVASRLESLAKAGQILVSQRTYSKVKGQVEVEKVGIIQVQGLRDPVVTYSVKVPPS
jgi:class 3 adenylate cyclase